MKPVNDEIYIALVAHRLGVDTDDVRVAFLQFGRSYGQIANFLQHGGAL
ncbi:MAG: hypothetical protein Q8L10_01515 [Candidatus Moranbacteria bacterium]|nr:hypothetical protein [Candidatus Moranbacteria bacterium]